MAKVAIVLGEDFEDSEFETPHTTLLDNGHEVTVVGVEEGMELTGKRGRVHQKVERAASDVDPSQFDALVIPGGYSPDHLRTDEEVVRFVRGFFDADKPVGAICHAGSLLIEADVVDGRTVTSWPSIRRDLVNAGAAWMDGEVVVDANLVTSRKPDDIPAFVDAVLGKLPAARVSA